MQIPHSLPALAISRLQGVCRCCHFLALFQAARAGSRFGAPLSGRPWCFVGDVGDLSEDVMFAGLIFDVTRERRHAAKEAEA